MREGGVAVRGGDTERLYRRVGCEEKDGECVLGSMLAGMWKGW